MKLINGLGQAGSGSSQLQSGLEQAVSGANQLHGGSGQAQAGAAQLHAGLAQARAGSGTLAAGLDQALSGAQSLKTGAGQALSGSTQLLQGISLAQGPANQSIPALSGLSSLAAGTSSAISAAQTGAQATDAQVGSALAALQSMTTGKDDPRYGAAVAALQSAGSAAAGLSGQIGAAAAKATAAKGLASTIAYQAPGLVAALNLLHAGASQLQSGIRQLRDGNSQLANGIRQLAGGGGQLKGGLGQLTDGAAQLQAGLALLTNGTGQLASGLASAPNGAGQLVTGLGLMQAAVVKARGQIPSTKDLETLQKQSPGLFNSGYFVLAAVAGAQPADRNAATFTINLLRGGTAGQIVVVSKYKANDSRSEALGTSLANLGQAFGQHNHVQVVVGGPAGNLGDLTSVTKSRIPLAIAVLGFALALVLVLALRSIILPVVTMLFSLLVATSTFGVLQLLFGGSNPPLGGPGYMDPMSILGIFTVVFSIAVTYSTLLLMRTREAFVAGGRSRDAVRTGLRQTAAPATGAGLVMVAALIPFATSDLINVRQFGIGVAVAILLEVLIVRPVLLPAAEAVLGRYGWWPSRAPHSSEPTAPSGMDRRLPRPPLPRRRPRPTSIGDSP